MAHSEMSAFCLNMAKLVKLIYFMPTFSGIHQAIKEGYL